MIETNKEKKQKNIRDTYNLSKRDYVFTKEDKTRLEELKNELNLLEKFGFTRNELKSITDFYNSHTTLELNSVSECVKLLARTLKLMGKTDEEIDIYIRGHKNIYLNKFEALEKRIKLFKKCNCLEEVLNKYSILLSSNNQSVNNTNVMLEYAKLNNYSVNLDEMSECMQTQRNLVLRKKSH